MMFSASICGEQFDQLAGSLTGADCPGGGSCLPKFPDLLRFATIFSKPEEFLPILLELIFDASSETLQDDQSAGSLKTGPSLLFGKTLLLEALPARQRLLFLEILASNFGSLCFFKFWRIFAISWLFDFLLF